ncbi:hypothetical protein B4U80_09369 [Leptotrombidium deliense]|uniref:Chromo domain-containing protein n=1 Tax=Leptotrombidium deliense TaxID=299467 RepID=A0A443SFT7_9ACAR|nr:hypothetical protein B4U80_09369 [Leptotrombidium deliense]
MAKANDNRSYCRVLADKAHSKKTGFDRGFTIKEIIGATMRERTIMFLVSWKETIEVELVAARIMNVKAPQLVIDFYEKRLSWTK